MNGYTKLFGSIIASTIWRETTETKVVWITMLAMANKHGIVEASIPGLADMARVPLAETQKALEILAAPDSFSRTKDFEGRRIEAVDGGWAILNHAKYREKMSADERRQYNRLKQQEFRERQKRAASTPSQQPSITVNHGQSALPMSAHADADQQKQKKKEVPPDLAEPPAPRARNPEMDALALLETPNIAEVTNWGKHAAALKKIRSVTPGVTADEINRRAANYPTHMSGALLTSTALANNWGMCAEVGLAKSSAKGKAGWLP